jgi:hypothetical protein
LFLRARNFTLVSFRNGFWSVSILSYIASELEKLELKNKNKKTTIESLVRLPVTVG